MSDLDVIREIEEIFNLKFRNYIRLENNLGEYTLDKNGKVTTLILSGIKITNFNRIISPLKQLKNLTKLFIHSNKLNDISLLKDLTTLSELNLSNNQIEDVSPLKDLKDLEVLLLSQNRINDIAALKYLKKLNFLWLWDNQIKDISPLKNLKKLKEIGLNSNNIEELPIWITDFNLDILYDIGAHDGKIHIGGNPLKSPPVEIAKQGKEAIKNYFSQLEKQGKDKIYEAKLMLVGEPGAGKTTLMNLLFDKEHPVPDMDQKSTTGIEVRQNWAFSIDRKKGFKAHIWDFGGQQIQYMLHQFFLTSDCVYVLMAEKRRELAKFEYWLNIINILGKNSPVVVVFNEINIDSVSSFIYDEKKYNNLFPELSLRRLDINLADMEDGRFDVLQNTIKIKLGSLQHIGKEVPARWVDIRKELENRRKKKHININEYFKICKKFDIEKEADQMLILGYFHLLGIVLHFHEDENLCDTLFLDPNWTVDAVYSVLANKEIEKSKGFIKKSDIDKIWSEKDYDIEERTKLLQLMLKDNFELCYKLPGTENQYIVPLLLSPQKPEYDWDSNNNLQFRFQYPFMPKGIVSRLIVRMHEYIDQNHVWKEGVVFRRNSASAQVIEQKTMKEGLKIIEIRLKGTPNNRKELLTLIREEIKKIQNSSFPNLPYSEMIPCNCRECKTAETPYFFNYDDIETYLQKGKTTIDCRKTAEDVPISNLVDSVFRKNDRIKQYTQRPKDTLQDNKIEDDVSKTKVKRDKVFISYSHKNKKWFKKVRTHLKVLESEGISVNFWADTEIKSGSKWREDIANGLSTAKVAILLVSTEFLASDFINKEEIPKLLKAAESDGATILPLILKPCRFIKNKKLSEFQAINDPAKPLSGLSKNKQEKILVQMTDRIAELISPEEN